MRFCMLQQPAFKITALLRNAPNTSISQGILRKTVTQIAASCPEYWRFLPFDDGGTENRKTYAAHPSFYYHFYVSNISFEQVLQSLLAHLQTAAHQPSALVFHSISCIFEGTVPKLKFVFLLFFVFSLFVRAAYGPSPRFHGEFQDVHRRASDDPPVLRGTGR